MEKNLLFSEIKQTILDIDNELKELNGKGIFFAPEIYIAFSIGKSIYKNRNSIFQSDKVEWERETQIKEYGIFDIGFKVNGERKLIIEIKLRDRGDAYKKDILRLRKLDGNIMKIFCVLMDTKYSESRKDSRVLYLRDEMKLEPVQSLILSTEPIWHPILESDKYFCDLLIYEVM